VDRRTHSLRPLIVSPGSTPDQGTGKGSLNQRDSSGRPAHGLGASRMSPMVADDGASPPLALAGRAAPPPCRAGYCKAHPSCIARHLCRSVLGEVLGAVEEGGRTMIRADGVMVAHHKGA
jgi:hypothetical protein